MTVKLQKKEAFKVLGFKSLFPTIDGKENFQEISAMWESITPEKMSKLISISNGKVNGFLGLSDENGEKHFNYVIGSMTQLDKQDSMQKIDFPEAEWLKFECTGSIPNAMMALKKEIIYDWLPRSEFVQLPIPRVEIYYQGDMNSSHYKSELWIPVKRK